MGNDLYEVLTDTIGEGLLMVNPSGMILAINHAFEVMTGYSTGELVGKSCRILNCSGCKTFGEEPGRQWCGLFEKGSVRNRRCRIVSKDGRTVHILKHGTVLRDENGCVTGAVEALEDISEMVGKEEEIESLRLKLSQQAGISGIVGTSRPIRELLDLIKNVALSGAPVLIQGESGVGKELVARAIHELGGGGDDRNFIKVNCASLNENLVESELFGHVRGAFTGAHRSRMGRFEAASDGSIFLDEIGDASPAFQAKLLRVLESKEIERVGDQKPISVQARVIAATNKDLAELVARKLFREDLFYRINVVPIFVPPLRERKEDIPLLAQTFIDRIAGQTGKPIAGLGSKALNIMIAHHWPGNVRELRNTIEHAFVLCHETLIGPQHLPPQLTAHHNGYRNRFVQDEYRNNSPSYSNKERDQLLGALDEAGGSRSKAAKILGVSRVTVWKRMKKFGISSNQGSFADIGEPFVTH
jgi:two-component system, NtrC family, response regulator HydG